MKEQPEKSSLSESWSENRKYWFPRWRTFLSPPFALTVAVAICVGITFTILQGSNRPMALIMFFLASCLSLAVLIAIFAAVTGGLRLHIAAVFLILLDGLALSTGASWSRIDAAIILLPLLVATPILVTLNSIKMFKGTFKKTQLNHGPFAEGLQFKINHLFIATAVLAIIIAIVQTFATDFSNSKTTYSSLTIVVVLLSSNALVSVWATLGKAIGKRLFVSLVVAIVLLIVAMATINFFVQRINVFDRNFWIGLATLSWAASTLQLYLFRRQGYRFVRHAK